MTVIFYVLADTIQLTDSNYDYYRSVSVRKPDGTLEYVYIRTEYFSDKNDELGALDKADPRPGEVVLNTVYINE